MITRTMRDLAVQFIGREREACEAEAVARTQCQKNTHRGVAAAWREAAAILSQTHYENEAAARVAASSIPEEG